MFYQSKDMNISLNLNDSQLKLPIEIINSLNESIANNTGANKVLKLKIQILNLKNINS